MSWLCPQSRQLAILLLSALLCACGGGGGGAQAPSSGSSTPPQGDPLPDVPPPEADPPEPEPELTVTATFVVTLDSIKVSRPSSGETVNFSIGIWNEGLEFAE